MATFRRMAKDSALVAGSTMEQALETHEKSAGETEASMAYASAMREHGTGRNTKYTINHQEHEERRASERREPEQPRPHEATRQQGSNKK